MLLLVTEGDFFFPSPLPLPVRSSREAAQAPAAVAAGERGWWCGGGSGAELQSRVKHGLALLEIVLPLWLRNKGRSYTIDWREIFVCRLPHVVTDGGGMERFGWFGR
eukprot:COSAG02_NODE_168_length_31711_cov_68.337973_7_plen_107_part_00